MKQLGHGSGSGIYAELESIKAAIDRHELEVAESKLSELELRSVSKLEPEQWYQMKVLRSRIYSDCWEWEKSGRLLLDAKRHLPDTERARINEALGYELIGDTSKAPDLASELLKEFPRSVRLLAIRVRTAPSSVQLSDLINAAIDFPNDDEDLTLALAHRAFVEARYDQVEYYTKIATGIDPHSPHAWFVRGQAKHAPGRTDPQSLDKTLLAKAKEYYDRAIQLAQVQKFHALEATVRVNRGKVKHLLEDRGAELDFVRAVELAPTDHAILRDYVAYLLDTGKTGNSELMKIIKRNPAGTSQ